MVMPVPPHCFFCPCRRSRRNNPVGRFIVHRAIQKEKSCSSSRNDFQFRRAKIFSTFTYTFTSLTSLNSDAPPHLHIIHLPPILQPTMSRSVADATRFTATSPHAYSKPTPLRSAASASSKTTPPHRFPNPNAPRKPPTGTQPTQPHVETPAEKVARLRAARLAQLEAQYTTWDRIVLRGRVWADRAHRVTVYTLVGFTGTFPPL